MLAYNRFYVHNFFIFLLQPPNPNCLEKKCLEKNLKPFNNEFDIWIYNVSNELAFMNYLIYEFAIVELCLWVFLMTSKNKSDTYPQLNDYQAPFCDAEYKLICFKVKDDFTIFGFKNAYCTVKTTNHYNVIYSTYGYIFNHTSI